MKILYLSEDYIYSKVHYNLCVHLWQQEQVETLTVFGVVRNVGTPRIDGNYAKTEFAVHVAELDANSILYRMDFSYKMRRKMHMLRKYVDCTNVDVTFAATLFSEGAIAYKLYRKCGIPYIVAVRGTDINAYLKFMPHLWPLAIKILNNAQHVVFINTIVRESLFKHWAIGRFIQKTKEKCSVKPNGIDSYWLENRKEQKKLPTGHHLLYIGNFDKNKNVGALQLAVLKVKESCLPDIKLTLVGGHSTHHDAVMAICNSHPDVFDYLGPIYDKKRLAEIMAGCDAFAMVSHSETFGLVYVEALSQGLPIIYTKGQGIDGYFKQKVGVAVDSHDVLDIENGIKKVFEEYGSFDGIGADLDKFCWPVIAKQYMQKFQSTVYNKSNKEN